jgi:hypothetical protein
MYKLLTAGVSMAFVCSFALAQASAEKEFGI